MALTTNPAGSVENQDDGVLDASISASATSLTISPVKKWINGVLTTGGFSSLKGFCKIIDSTGRYEFISFDTKNVDATTNVTTLSGIRRGLSVTASGYGSGTGMAFDANSRIYVCDYAAMWQNQVTTDTTQSISGAKTFSSLITATAGVAISGSSSYLKVPSLTTAQRTALTGENGMIVYDSDLGVHYQYIAGAWAEFATGTTANAANNTGGKVDLATEAEVAAGTATDAVSGSPNVIPVSIVKPTSTGAVSGTVPCLGTDSLVDITLGGTKKASWTAYALICGGLTSTGALQNVASVGTAGQVLTSAGAGALPTFQASKTFLGSSSVVNSNTVGNGTSEQLIDKNYTIGAASVAAGDVFTVFACGTGANNASPDVTVRLKLGTVTIVAIAQTGDFTEWSYKGYITVRTTGATGTAVGYGEFVNATSLPAFKVQTSDQVVDWTASNVLQLSVQYGGGEGDNDNMYATQFIVTKQSL